MHEAYSSSSNELDVTVSWSRDEKAIVSGIRCISSMTFKELVLGGKRDYDPLSFFGRLIVLVGLGVWGWTFVSAPVASNYVGESFMHNINLPFHEAGHIVFAPFGRFMQVLGGTLGQIIIPCLCVAAFLLKNQDPFGASAGLWWVGQNFLDIAPYINDARALELVLLGGVTGKDVDGYHDWQNILGALGWLEYDHVLAQISHGSGTFLMVLALVWGGTVLLLQFKQRPAFS